MKNTLFRASIVLTIALCISTQVSAMKPLTSVQMVYQRQGLKINPHLSTEQTQRLKDMLNISEMTYQKSLYCPFAYESTEIIKKALFGDKPVTNDDMYDISVGITPRSWGYSRR